LPADLASGTTKRPKRSTMFNVWNGLSIRKQFRAGLDGASGDSAQHFNSRLIPVADNYTSSDVSEVTDRTQSFDNIGPITCKKVSTLDDLPRSRRGLPGILGKMTRTCDSVMEFERDNTASDIPFRVPESRSVSPEPVPRSAVGCKELVETLRRRGGQVILVGQGSASSSAGAAPSDVAVGPEAAFVAVLVRLRDAPAGHRAVERLMERALPQPIVVILLKSEGIDALSEHVERLEETKAFIRLSAHGVYWQPKCHDDLEEIVDYWLACAAETKDMSTQRYQEEKERQAEEDSHRLEAKRRESGLFWEKAHEIFGNFPPLCQDLAEPALGGNLGRHHNIIKTLGVGNFGKVMLLQEKQTQVFKALKVVGKKQLDTFDMVEALSKEIGFSKRLVHPNIMSFCGAAHSNLHIMLLLEYVGPKNLYEFHRDSGAKSLPPQISRAFFKQAASAIVYCHSQGVAHRDLKQENLVVSPDCQTVKVVDFGQADSVHVTWEAHGTVPFVAPEVLAEDERDYDAAKADVWALGVVLVEMLCGLNTIPGILRWKMPVDANPALAKDLRGLISPRREFCRSLASAAPHGSWSSELGNLLQNVLTPSSAERWNAGQVAEVDW